jgi:hypothetical protein
MAEINLSQAEADALIAMEKQRLDDQRWNYPELGGIMTIPLVSKDIREKFLLDINRGRIDLLKGTYQNRSREIIVLVRLDFGGRPHRNPDDSEIPSPHLHLYREGYGDKWAIPIPIKDFPDIQDLWKTLSDFMRYCNISEPPYIDKGLFS